MTCVPRRYYLAYTDYPLPLPLSHFTNRKPKAH